MIGREKEINQLTEILARRTKNNALLIGELGIGKAAGTEGLAQRIIDMQVPTSLHGKEIFSLDVGALVAGIKYRGSFEKRIERIMGEIQKAQNVILLIDEIHMIMGGGEKDNSSEEGSNLSAADLLKPALSRGQFQCINATTFYEYKKYIEKDHALERRFQLVNVNEPSVDETITILCGLRDSYEKYHEVTISDGAISAAANLAYKYIPGRFLPDKAIDLINEAVSAVCRAVKR